MRGFKLDPNTRRKLQRFRSIKRGYYSFIALAFFVALALLGPWLVNNRALAVRYDGSYFFPTLGGIIPGKTFGLDYEYETDYRALKEHFASEGKGNWVFLPPVPYNGTEVCEVLSTLDFRGDGRYYLPGAAMPLAEGQVCLLHPNGRPRRVWRVVAGRLHGLFQGYDMHGNLVEKGRWENGAQASYAALNPALPPVFAEPDMGKLRSFLPYPNKPGVAGHLLGTDESGHDVLARLFYGFRILCAASVIYLAFTYIIGIAAGCAMGYFGGWFDIVAQRGIEIWSNIPHLYLIIFLSSMLVPDLFWLMIIIVAFSWITLTYYMRTGTYREKERDYVAAARLLGAGAGRIIFRHILPNTLSTVVTFVPFMVAAVVFQLTALDFLGFGLPPTEPTWGEMLKQGTENFDSPWILGSVVACLVTVLVLITFVGEAVREAFDPKKFTVYQ
ncbi:MAG: ABC transporter permease subunit [Puniceicoccales bacterium]|jgi:microcin C transport system permease protein|nr:ABC transporter permease subunit [Puniceicoccales bacterium]